MNKAERQQIRPVLRGVDLWYRARKLKMQVWDQQERTVTREIAQVEASGGDFCRHVEGLVLVLVLVLVLALCDQLRGRWRVWESERAGKTEAVSDRDQVKENLVQIASEREEVQLGMNCNNKEIN